MYKRPKDIMEEYKISRSTFRRMIEEMQGSGRYPRSAIIGDTCRRIDGDAFQDFLEVRAELKHPTMRRYLKPYKGGNT